jgi:hypothetical protein
LSSSQLTLPTGVSSRAKRQQTRRADQVQPAAASHRPTTRTPETTPRRKKAAAPSKKPKSPNALSKGVTKGIFHDPEDANAEEAAAGAQEDADAEEAEEAYQESSMVAFADDGEDRVYGQRARLETMRAALEAYMLHVQEQFPKDYRAERQLELVRQSEQLRQDIRSKYSAMLAGDIEDMDAHKEDIHDSLSNLIELAKSVRPDEARSVNASRKLAKQFYAFIVVDLVKVLLRSAHCYNCLASVPNEVLDIPELNQLIRLSKCIVDVCENAKTWKVKVDQSLALVRPVQNNFLAPVKKILVAFQKAKLALHEERKELEASQRRHERAKLEEEREEMEREELRREIEIRKRLRFLYTERQLYGGGARKFFMPRISFAKGHADTQTYPFGLDSNGHPIERIDVFEARRTSDGQSPSDGEASINTNVTGKNWPVKQLMAMEYALREFCGLPGTDLPRQREYFWPKVMDAYCRWDGPFADLTLHDILTMARDFQYAQLFPDEEVEVEREDWFTNIPDLELLKYLPEE